MRRGGSRMRSSCRTVSGGFYFHVTTIFRAVRNTAQHQGPSLPLDTPLPSSIPSQPFPFSLLGERGPQSPTVRYADSGCLYSVIPFVPSTVLRQSFDNNIGFIHVRVDEANEEPIALADIYRMDGTCIVEHWDVTQSRPANATNPIAMF